MNNDEPIRQPRNASRRKAGLPMTETERGKLEERTHDELMRIFEGSPYLADDLGIKRPRRRRRRFSERGRGNE